MVHRRHRDHGRGRRAREPRGGHVRADGVRAAVRRVRRGVRQRAVRAWSTCRPRRAAPEFSGELRYMTDDYGAPEMDLRQLRSWWRSGSAGLAFTDKLRYCVVGPGELQRRLHRQLGERGPSATSWEDFWARPHATDGPLRGPGRPSSRSYPNRGKKLTFEYLLSEVVNDPYVHSFSRSGYWSVPRQDWSHVALDSTYRFYNAAEHTGDRSDTLRREEARLARPVRSRLPLHGQAGPARIVEQELDARGPERLLVGGLRRRAARHRPRLRQRSQPRTGYTTGYGVTTSPGARTGPGRLPSRPTPQRQPGRDTA